MRIIAYTYDADTHCVDCAREKFGVNTLMDITKNDGYGSLHTLTDGTTEKLDENLIPIDQEDSEMNPIHPVFSTDEQLEPLFCGDCGEEIE